jgi:putative transposase
VWPILRRAAKAQGLQSPNHKRLYRVMKAHGLLLQRHVGGGEERRHDGRIAVDNSNLRWCSDDFELRCDNGEKVRIAFALDCCDREAMGFVATTEGIKGEDVREHRFGRINRLPETIEWLTDNGSGYIAHATKRFARDIGFTPRTTPIEPSINGMAEAVVRTMKRDYARVSQLPDAAAVMRQLPAWFDHYNTVHPHRALSYRSPRGFIASRSNRGNMSDLLGATTGHSTRQGRRARSQTSLGLGVGVVRP